MENATNALMIAAGVLIGILIISLLVNHVKNNKGDTGKDNQ